MLIVDLNIAAYIIINLLLFSSWHVILFRHRETLSFADRIIGVFVLGLAQIIATELLLGVVFKRLFAAPLFGVNAAISSAVLIYSAAAFKTQKTRASVLTEVADNVVRFFNILKTNPILLSIFIIFSISICWIIFLGYLFPSYTWDALWYHLPIVGYIMQSGAIREIPNDFIISQFINIFPKNIELFFVWNIIFLKSEVLADLSQLAFTIIGLFTIYSMSLKLQLKEKNAVFAALLFFFAPIIILQSTTNYVDITVSVLFLIAVNFLIKNNPGNIKDRAHEPGGGIPVVLSGLAAGILLGSKGSGPLFIIVLSAAIVIQETIKCLSERKTPAVQKRRGFGASSRLLLIYFATPVLIMGGYWYFKNWALYNNPVYPMEVSIFNITLFKGLYKEFLEPAPAVFKDLSPLKKLLYVWMERDEYYFYDSRRSGFGPLWFILFLPALIFSLIHAAIKKRYGFLAVSAILVCAFLLYPRNWNTRYVIFLFGLGALAYGYILDYSNDKGKALEVIAVLLAGYTALASNSPCVTPSQIKKFLRLPAGERTIARHAPFSIDLHARQEYGHWIWISNNISKGDTLAYTFEPLFLAPLWNSAFSNKVAYIKSDSYNNWLKKLDENNAGYALIRRNSEEDKWIDREREIFSSAGWLGGLKERFKIVYSDENYKIARYEKNED